MERMEVDQCAGAAAAGGASAAGGGGALRRSNSAPMITSVSSDGMTVFGPVSSARYRRSSVSINPSCPRPIPLSPFSLNNERLEHKTQEEEMALRGSLRRLSSSSLMPLPSSSQWPHHTPAGFHAGQDGGVTPNSSPSPTRRFRPVMSSTLTRPTLTPLKRKGGVESDGPPKKLFIAGVTDPAHHNNYTFSVSQAVVGSPPGGGVVLCSRPQDGPLSLSPPPSYSPHHPRH